MNSRSVEMGEISESKIPHCHNKSKTSLRHNIISCTVFRCGLKNSCGFYEVEKKVLIK